jgi:putative transposase
MALGMAGISKSQVSRPCEEIDGKVKAFLERPREGDWSYLKVRQNDRIISVAAISVNADGRREVLGLEIGTSQAETFWDGLPQETRPARPAWYQAGDLGCP